MGNVQQTNDILILLYIKLFNISLTEYITNHIQVTGKYKAACFI